ncbi:MAG: sulfite exporter TauE/SafE family protein, partial [Bacteroidales bacterium]|nr:sulfite exporter TauE/SafE family protein [Bacteroidales bacterium]
GGTTLEIVLSLLLFLAGVAMLFPEKQGNRRAVSRFGFWNIHENDNIYVVNLWMAVPLTIATGFFSGMVGISGGSFLVPLMVVGCDVPIRIAVGTATAMLAATALTGFAGNALHGGFDPLLAIPCGTVAIVGGLIGSKIALKTKPKSLKTISGVLTIIAAIVMLLNAIR